MSIYNTNQCEHGSLERKCEICERDNEIKELKAELAAAKGQVERMREALERISDLSQECCYTFEEQSFKATDIANEALSVSPSKEANKEAGELPVTPAIVSPPSCEGSK